MLRHMLTTIPSRLRLPRLKILLRFWILHWFWFKF